MMLDVRGLHAGYGMSDVLHGVDLDVEEGTIVALVGSNGAGKSTLLRAISGLLRPRAGTIRVRGRATEGRPPRAVVGAGVVHVPEGRQIFGDLSVRDNLLIGAFSQRRRLQTAEIDARIDSVCTLFPVVRERLSALACTLSGGQQQMLAIARGLMSRPQLLLLDEPSLGLSPLLVTEIFSIVQRLRDEGVSILLSEQNARLSLAIADVGYVMDNGVIAMRGSGRQLLGDPRVVERYLGVGGASDAGESAAFDLLTARLRNVLTPISAARPVSA